MIKYKIIYSKQGKTVIKITSKNGIARRGRPAGIRKTIMVKGKTFCPKINKKARAITIYKLHRFLKSIG